MSDIHSRAAKKRLAYLTPEERSNHMANIVKKGRWNKTTLEERKAHAKKMLEGRYGVVRKDNKN